MCMARDGSGSLAGRFDPRLSAGPKDHHCQDEPSLRMPVTQRTRHGRRPTRYGNTQWLPAGAGHQFQRIRVGFVRRWKTRDDPGIDGESLFKRLERRFLATPDQRRPFVAYNDWTVLAV